MLTLTRFFQMLRTSDTVPLVAMVIGYLGVVVWVWFGISRSELDHGSRLPLDDGKRATELVIRAFPAHAVPVNPASRVGHPT